MAAEMKTALLQAFGRPDPIDAAPNLPHKAAAMRATTTKTTTTKKPCRALEIVRV